MNHFVVLTSMDAKRSFFTRLARGASEVAGKPATFAIALAVVLGWAASGPIFRYSDTWQLLINTSTTVATFLMVFLMQSTQNRDTKALQVKLDELLMVTERADKRLLDLEELDESDLTRLQRKYEEIAERERLSQEQP